MTLTKLIASWFCVVAAATALSAQTTAVVVQAETGTRGAEVAMATEGATQFVRATTTSAGNNPGGAARVVTLTVAFPAAGNYDLYARLRVGAGGFDDDSFFYGNGFGAKSATTDADWITVNGLAAAGYATADEVVGGVGTAGNGEWKWLKLSSFAGGISFTVPAGALTQTFQIGVREDGLDLDQLAFGPSGLRFTVANLDQGQSGSAAPGDTPYTPSGPPLATGHTKFLGSIYSASQIPNFTAYFNQVTPENAGKWGSIENVRDTMNWTEIDAAYALAKNHGFPFRFHVLVWGSQQPAWIETLSTADQLEEITEWFDAVAARYSDLDYIEVVNEPLHAPPNQPGNGRGNYINALGGTGASGWDWVLTAFRMARARFPATTKLVLNDYGITSGAASTQSYLKLINLLQAEKLIDVIAVQQHAFETRVSNATLKANLDLLAATGLPIMITEMDIDDGASPAQHDDQIQLADYQRLFPLFWEHPSIIGITLWGYRPGLWRNENGAYIARENGSERPALQWLKTYLRTGHPTFTAHPQNQSVDEGGNITLTAAANATATPTFQWRRNGRDVAGATNSALVLNKVQPADAGVYTAVATNKTAYAISQPAIVGVTTSDRVIGTGEIVLDDVAHPNGNRYDQVLVTGAAETVTATPGRVMRTSFIDLDDDIVQVEFSGPGTLSLVFDDLGNAERAAPVNYNQSNVKYVKGHAAIVIVGANEFTNVSVFTVGRATAVDPTGTYDILKGPGPDNEPAKNGSPLFVGHEATNYDGIADLAFIAIASENGKFGGVRAANAHFFAEKGLTGVYAPGVALQGPLNVGDITAFRDATPVLRVGSVGSALIAGGNLAQANAQPVQVSGLTKLNFTAGSDSAGRRIEAQNNQAVLQQDGVDVTSQVVVNP
ncbi:MAG TPA: endo-1,4-beta-xylanase [Opitutus sp.]|nr:endo-1,4-beta-xylanase [Opitutus sp.]